MKQFSVFCSERSIVLEDYPEKINSMPRVTMTFANIQEKYTLSDISWLAVGLTLLLDTILILSTVRLGVDSPFFIGAIVFAFIGSLKFVNAFEKIIRINFTKEGRLNSRIHSAMHQAINAMIKEDTVNPDISKIQSASRFSSSCNTVYTIESILLGIFSIPIVIFTYHKLWLCIILLLLLRVIVENLLDRGAFNFLQVLFLRKPTDKEINLVSAMLQQNDELVKSFKDTFLNEND